MAFDGLLATLALVGAFGLRLNGDMVGNLPVALGPYVGALLVAYALSLPLVLAVLGAYRRPIGEALVAEIWAVMLGTTLLTGLLAGLRLAGVSPLSGSIAIISGLTFFGLAVSVRLVARAQRSLVDGVPVGGVLTDDLAPAEPAVRVAAPMLESGPSHDVTLGTLGLSLSPRRVPGPVGASPLVVVTGGGGYVGSHLVRQLLASGRRVRVLDNFAYGRAGLRDLSRHPLLEIVEGDVSSVRDVGRAVQDADAVVALAAIVGDPACGLDAAETLAVNYESTKAMVEGCRFYGVRRLVFASSCSVYGASNGRAELDEASPVAPVSLYAQTRVLSEQVLFERCGGVEPVVLRLATVFGHSSRMRYDLVVNALTVRALVEGRFQIFGGQQWRPFVHCHDAANAFLRAVVASSEGVAGEVFNVGSERLNHTLLDVGRLVCEGVPSARMEVVEDIEDVRNYRVSFGKAAGRLGFVPDYDLRAGIHEMIEAVRRDEALRDFSDVRFSNHDQYRLRLSARTSASRL